MKILIIEDEPILVRVLEDKFKGLGLEVKVATNGDEAISMAASFKPDLILLDLILPKKSGFEFLEALRADPEIRNIPVIVLSNLGQEEDIKRAFELGVKDYLVKIHHPTNEVVEKIKSYLYSKPK